MELVIFEADPFQLSFAVAYQYLAGIDAISIFDYSEKDSRIASDAILENPSCTIGLVELKLGRSLPLSNVKSHDHAEPLCQSNQMTTTWQPISDYESDPSSLHIEELAALVGAWLERRDEVRDSAGVLEFFERLERRWAIETGLIERLYSLDYETKALMIEHGISSSFKSNERSKNVSSETLAILEDQQNAIVNMNSFVRDNRELSTSYIKEIHQLFTRNQAYVKGRDRFGKMTTVELTRGEYKKLPNNPTSPDGNVHHYCPPEHVESEMDRLIQLHHSHENVAPEVEAAWIHHRFTQIHPFHDGNGRIARALATLEFIKANWLPLVIQDTDRSSYLDALERADNHDLKPLIAFFATLQRRELAKVISLVEAI